MTVFQKHALCRALSLIFCAGGLAFAPADAGAADDRDVQASRVKEIAAMLSEGPTGVGRPIDDRAAWKKLASLKAYSKVISGAESQLNAPLSEMPDELYLDYSKTGNRTRWQAVNSNRRKMLKLPLLAECIENKGRFIPRIEYLVREYCKQRTWVMPAHDKKLTNHDGSNITIDLASSAWGWSLASVDSLLGDRLSPDVRQLIRERVDHFIFTPYRDQINGRRKMDFWVQGTNNWNAVCQAGVTGAALALIESREERAWFIAAAEAKSRYFLDGFTADGYCSEGLGYWNYGFGNYLMLSETIHQATGEGVNLLESKRARAAALFPSRIEIGDGVSPAFADCSVNAHPAERAMWFISRRLELGMGEWEREDPAIIGGSIPEDMLYGFPNSASATPPAKKQADGLALRDWFNDAGILICRPGESDARLAVALKGGHNNEHHNHNDVGSYVIVTGGETPIVDPGGEVYTARTFSGQRYVSGVLNSLGHSVPRVAGQLQQTGGNAKAKIVSTDFTDNADTLVLDMTSAYKTPGLKKLTRTFVYSREGDGSLTVTDEVAFSKPQTFETAIVTHGGWSQTDKGRLLIRDQLESVEVEGKASADLAPVTSEEINEDTSSRRTPIRLAIAFAKPITQGSITLTIRPVNASSAVDGEGLLRNGSFEEGSEGWSASAGSLGAVSDEQASEGEFSLKIVDADETRGSNVSSNPMRAKAETRYILSGQYYGVSGDGIGMYMKYANKRRRLINETSGGGNIAPVGRLDGTGKEWKPFAFEFTTPAETASLHVWIHSFNASFAEGYIDDLKIAPAR